MTPRAELACAKGIEVLAMTSVKDFSIGMARLAPPSPSEKIEAENQHFPDIGQIVR
jgi:hypothetical protein